MIMRIEKCTRCGRQVSVLLPDLFPDITAKSLEKFKRLSLIPIKNLCKHCADNKEEN